VRIWIKSSQLISKVATHLLNCRLDERIQRRTGLLPISQTEPEDIFLVGYPKSGNTWMQHLVAGLVYGLDPTHLPYALVDDLVPDVHARRYYRRYAQPMYFKSHSFPQPQYRRVIYLLRDGRDVMVSYFHHLNALQRRPDIDFANVVRNGQHLYPGKWHEHVMAWQSNPYKAEMLTLKYEDLLADPVSQLNRICNFLSITRPIFLVESVIQGTSFVRMRAKEEKFGLQDSAWPKDRSFIRRGIVGSHKDEMPKQVLDLFLMDAAETLRACAYL
jgi:hypothetical protein